MADEKKIDPGDPFASFRGGLDDLFGAVRPQKADVSLALSISLAEAAHGASRPISRERSTRCAACAGLGGQQGAERSACEACSGTGETRAQSKLELKIPPGVADGSVLRLAGQGDERGQGPGDLYVTIEVAPHPTLERVGDDLHARVRFDAERAARGGTLIVPWLEGSARVPMPAGSRPGDTLRLPGWGCVKLGAAYAPPPVSGGAPYRTAAATRGDLIVRSSSSARWPPPIARSGSTRPRAARTSRPPIAGSRSRIARIDTRSARTRPHASRRSARLTPRSRASSTTRCRGRRARAPSPSSRVCSRSPPGWRTGSCAEAGRPRFSGEPRQRRYSSAPRVKRSLEQLHDTIEAASAMPDASAVAERPRHTIEPRHRKSAEVARALGLLSPSQRGVDVHATLGEGGMGIVRLGTQRALGRDVAVKSVKEDAKSDAATLKLLREAWVTGALEHPNVVPVYDIELGKDGDPQIVLKKIEGAPWCDLMGDGKELARRFHVKDALDWNLRILQQVATAVHFAHSRGIVHRDLKPENVMIGSHGEVYLVDWGLAVAVKDDGTGRFPLAAEAHEMAGTPCYMAPEMIGGPEARISERTDVYLLGAILHELATGRVPHEGESLMTILMSVARSEPQLDGDVPAELARIIRRAMDPDPDARFETAEQFRLAIGGFLEHRGSIRLAAEAEERLERLLEERDKPGADEGEKRLALYHYFGECRFGFLEALRAWKGNEAAQKGLAKAIVAMIEFELSANDARAASVLLAELREPPAELSVRVSEALTKANEERDKAAKLAREHDESTGRRTRAFLAIVLGSLWTLGPLAWAWAYGWSEWARSHWAAIEISIATGVVGQSLYWWARDSMSKTIMNRRLVWTVRITVWAQLALTLGAYVAGIQVEQANTLLIFTWSLVLAQTANTIENRLVPAVIASVAAFFVACWQPAWVFYCMSASNFALLVNMVAVWSRLKDDFVDPLQKRAEERHQRWAAFLEKSRLDAPTSEPPDAER